MSRDLTFGPFLGAYPPARGLTRPLDGVAVAEKVEQKFGIDVPGALQFFWLRVGAGMFGVIGVLLALQARHASGRDCCTRNSRFAASPAASRSRRARGRT